MSTLARLHLDRVNDRAQGNLGKRQRVTWIDFDTGSGHDLVADLEIVGTQDVALVAIRVVEQRDIGAAVGVVFDSRNLGRDIELVPLEIDLAVSPFVTAAAMPRGDSTVDVATATLGDPTTNLSLLRPFAGDFCKVGNTHVAAPRRGGLVDFDRHGSSYTPSKNSMLCPSASFTMAFFHSVL